MRTDSVQEKQLAATAMMARTLQRTCDQCNLVWTSRLSVDETAMDLEKGAAMLADGDVGTYKTAVRTMCGNMGREGAMQGGLVDKLRRGMLRPMLVARMQPLELCSDRQRAQTERLVEHYTISPAVHLKNNAGDGMYTCGKCRSTKTRFEMYQSRSGDEPMTVAVECLTCGKRWKH